MLSRTLAVNPRLTLELIDEQHVPAGAALIDASRAELVPWMPWAPTSDEAAFAAFVAGKVAARATSLGTGGAAYAILVDGAFAGCIDFHGDILGERSAQIGYWLGTPYTGHGWMTACLRVLVYLGFRELGLERIELLADVENAPSRKVAERAGFILERTRPRGALSGIERYEALYVRVARPAPTIETQRLRLRGWTPADVEPFVQMFADPRVNEFLGAPRPRDESVALAERLAARLDQNGYGWWIAEVKTSGAFAGVIALQDIPFESAFAPSLEVGWHLAFDHWKHGYASEGGRALLDHAFAALGRDRVVAITASTNLRSQAVMERIGMVRDPDGDFEHPWIPAGSPLRPHVLYVARR